MQKAFLEINNNLDSTLTNLNTIANEMFEDIWKDV
jgi:hypothetical protein